MISIERDTVLLPYIIAQHAIWEVLESEHPELTPERCYQLQEAIVPLLEKKAEQVYINNKSWRTLLKHKCEGDGEAGRDMLLSFMHNWGEWFLNEELKKSKVIKLK